MDEERPCVEKLVPVKTAPLVSAGPGLVALFRHRVRRRGKSEDIKNQGLVVPLPTILDESASGFPTMRYCVFSILRPLPIGAAVDVVGQLTNFALARSVAIEILRCRQCARDQEGGIDCRQFRFPRP